MGVYNLNGDSIASVYNLVGEKVAKAYNLYGEDLGLSGIVKNPYYAFSEMSMVDSDSITSLSDLHLRNAEHGVLITTPDTSAHTVSFTCNIPTNGKRIGLFIWSSRKNIDNGITLSISVDGTSKTPKVKEGFDYYWFDGITENITLINVTVISKVAGAEIYLDSVEVGYYMTEKATIMFNFDTSPRNFMVAGFDLFAKYGFKATTQYNVDYEPNGNIEGAPAIGFDADIHKRLIDGGHDYASYSGWNEKGYGNKLPIPSYTDESAYDEQKAHADIMWKLNNSEGVYAPVCVHSNYHKAGEVYERALVDAGFPMIRIAPSNDNNACFAHFDSVDYRAMIPYFITGVVGADEVQGLKDVIYYACNNNLCLQIGSHMVEEQGLEELTHSMNIGYEAMNEILRYIKTKVDAGVCEVITTQEFIRRYVPDLYSTWYEERKKSTFY